MSITEQMREVGAFLSLRELFENNAEKAPGRLGLVYYGPEALYRDNPFGGRRTWTNYSILNIVSALGNFIISHSKYGEGVASLTGQSGIAVHNDPYACLACLAASAVGRVSTQLNTAWDDKLVAYGLNYSEAKILFASTCRLPTILSLLNSENPEMKLQHLETIVVLDKFNLGSLNVGSSTVKIVPLLEAITCPVLRANWPEVQLDDPVFGNFTSGSTGPPKYALHAARALLFVSASYGRHLGLTEKDAVLSFLPLYHAFGDGIMGIGLANMVPIVLMAKYRNASVGPIIEDEAITVVPLSPKHAEFMIKGADKINESYLRSVRYVVSGAEPLSEETTQKFTAVFGENLGTKELVQGCGPTESRIAGFAVQPSDVRKGPTKFGSIGSPIPGIEVELRPVEGGEVICLKGPSIMLGYMGDPEKTKAVLDENGWLNTRDLGEIDENGEYHIVGRDDDMVKIRGEKVLLNEVTAALKRNPAVFDAVAVAVMRGEEEVKTLTLVALVVRKRGDSLTADEVLAHCQSHFGDSLKEWIPGEVVFVDRIDITKGVGKTDRSLLSNPDNWALYQNPTLPVAAIPGMLTSKANNFKSSLTGGNWIPKKIVLIIEGLDATKRIVIGIDDEGICTVSEADQVPDDANTVIGMSSNLFLQLATGQLSDGEKETVARDGRLQLHRGDPEDFKTWGAACA